MAVTVKKISVAIGAEELAWAERRARKEKTSVSAVLTAAARAQREAEREAAKRRKAWATFVDHATDGRGLTAEELARGRRELEDE